MRLSVFAGSRIRRGHSATLLGFAWDEGNADNWASETNFARTRRMVLLLQRLLFLSLAILAPAVQADDASKGTFADTTASTNAVLHHGAVGVGSWNTSVEYKDIVVTSNGVVLYRSDFANRGTIGWDTVNGTWSIQNGALRQAAPKANCRAITGDTNWANYTITLRARKLGGDEGFLILFNWLDEENWTWFNVGRWGSFACIERSSHGSYAVLGDCAFQPIETNVWYDIRVVQSGPRIECYVNERLVEAVTCSGDKVQFETATLGSDAGVHGAIGLGSSNTSVEYKDLVVNSNDVTLYQSDFANQGTDGWRILDGTWSAGDGTCRQTAIRANCRAITGDTNWSNYTITLQARKTGGEQGFLIFFNWIDDDNWFCFNVGDRNNTRSEIQHCVNGQITHSELIPHTIESGVWHRIRVVVNGSQIECYVDARLVVAATCLDDKVTLKTIFSDSSASVDVALHGAIGVGSWNTSVEYKDIVVTSNDVVLYRSGFANQGTNSWCVLDGPWSIQEGGAWQTLNNSKCRAITGDTNWVNYTISLRARKISGDDGFVVYFNWLGEEDWSRFVVGAWRNAACAIQRGPKDTDYRGSLAPLRIEPNVWYDLQVVVNGPRILGYVNGRLATSRVVYSPAGAERLNTLSSSDAFDGRAFHAEGVVVYADPIKGEVLFKDALEAIPVAIDLNKNPIQPGMRVALDGKTSAQLIRYPDHPSGSHYLTSFEAPMNVDDLYFARVRGFLHPPRTGEYTFWIASDNGSELWLSTDEDPKHARKIATINADAYTSFHGWDMATNQHSAKINLEADKKYYIEALHWEQIGEDFLSVAWDGPGISRSAIDGAFLSPPATDANAQASSPDKRGSILREFWLKYPFATDEEGISWKNSVAAGGDTSVGALIKNPPTYYGKPVIAQAHLTPLQEKALPSPMPISLEQPWTELEDYQWVEAGGVISQIASVDAYWTILELTDQGHQMTVRLANPRQERLGNWVNARVRTRGFCAGARTQNGERLASVLWVPSVRDVSLMSPASNDWARLPLVPVRDLNSTHTMARAGQRARLGGLYLEGKPGEFLVLRDAMSRFSAFVSTDGKQWSQIGSPIEIPMNRSIYSGIATYAISPRILCSATYEHVDGSLFPGKEARIGIPSDSGSIQGNAEKLVIRGTGNISGRAGIDVFHNDEFHFLYNGLNGDGEYAAQMASVSIATTAWLDGGSGLMLRESLEPNSTMFYLAVSTVSGIDLRVRRGTGNPIESFPHGAKPPCWLKVVRQSAPPVKAYCTQFPDLTADQSVEVMGVLEFTNQTWSLNQAFCRIPTAGVTESNAPGQSQTEITSIGQIRQLGADELKLQRPARICGVITAKAGDLYVQDDTGGIRIPSIAAQKFINCEVGQRISIVGRYAPGGFSPMLEPNQQEDAVRTLGSCKMPKPLARTWGQLMLGRQDAQWVEVTGVIRKIQGRTLKLQISGGDIFIDLCFDCPEERCLSLIDSTVCIQGVCRVTTNEKKQLTGVRLIVPKADFIFVDEAPPPDPFAVASRPINQILRSGDQTELIHRLKIEGVVTYFHNGVSYIQDATGGIGVASDATALNQGDHVEVLGFPESTGSTVSLADAQIRKTAGGALPEPVKLESSLPQAAHASRLVSMSAVFLGHSTLLNNDVLQLQSGGRIFQGVLPKDCGILPDLDLGSLLHLTGVCRMVKDSIDGYSESNPEFELLLSAPQDVTLIQAPPWWNWRRLLWVGATFLGAMTLAAAWIAMILRKNRLLKTAQFELQKANDELEIRVERRTSDLAKANTELTYEQGLLRALLDTASDYIYFKDTASRFVRCSLSMCARSHLTHEQMVGATDFDIYREEHARHAFEDEQNIIRTGQPLIAQLEKEVHPDGRVTWVMTTKMPWRDSQGKTIGTFGISHDITSIKEAEARLEQVHKQLVDASRTAGQAEVAANVLHNVGNVLNSVNVSVGMIRNQVEASQVIESISRIESLLVEHQHDLVVFLSQNGRAEKVRNYLKSVLQQLSTEKAQMLEELRQLTANVNHVNEVIALQQNYAHVAGLVEVHSMPALVEDALVFHAAALEKRNIRVVRQFDDVPDIPVDKHRVLQILVNLISNAKWALSESRAPEPVLTLGVSLNGDNHLRVSIADNGVGISPEHLGQLFRHGFTTRPDGHGFGLHSSILAAREIGGNLTAHSEGRNRGAVFTLELPLQPKELTDLLGH
jgi:PAS domain S-box-containing protein